MNNDHEILARSLKNPDEFATIVDRYQQVFLRKVRSIIRNPDDAEDIVQEVFVKIYLNASSFSSVEGASFKSWAFKILLNTTFTYYQKKKRERALIDITDDELIDAMRLDNDEFSNKLILDHFLAVVSKIPVRFGKLLKKFVIEGKSDQQIAEEEGISAGAVRTRLYRAKSEFKKANLLI